MISPKRQSHLKGTRLIQLKSLLESRLKKEMVKPGWQDSEFDEIVTHICSEAERIFSEDPEESDSKSVPWAWLSKDQLVRMEHEMCTPLSLILGPLYTLMSDAATPRRNHRELNRIHRNSLRLLNMVYDFLELAKIEAGCVQLRRRSMAPGPILIREIEELSPALDQRDITISWDFEPDTRLVADPARLERLLVHFLAQVVRLIPKQGCLTVRTIKVQNQVRILLGGANIPINKAEQLLEPGRYTAGDGHSPGLGLVLANRLAVLMEGRLGVENRAGQSYFFVELPLAVDPNIVALEELPRRTPSYQEFDLPTKIHQLPRFSQNRRTIIAVGLDLDIAAWMSETLGPDFQVKVLEDLDFLTLEKEDPETILLDIILEKANLSQFQKSEKLRSVPIILCQGSDEDYENASPQCSILFKPYEVKHFLATIHSALGRRQLLLELEETRAQLNISSQRAGLTEMVTGILHNVGNVLNNINVSTDFIHETCHKMEVGKIDKAASLLKQHLRGEPIDIDNATIQRLADYLDIISSRLSQSQELLSQESQHLRENVGHIRNVIDLQQNLARTTGFTEILPIHQIIETALSIEALSLKQLGIEVQLEIEEIPALPVDKHRILQILINLISNARHAITVAQDRKGLIRIQAHLPEQHLLRVSVSDSGCGIDPIHLSRVFDHGYTTRSSGFGFGLHASVSAATDLGGALTCHSDGPGRGATFSLDLPLNKEFFQQANRSNTA